MQQLLRQLEWSAQRWTGVHLLAFFPLWSSLPLLWFSPSLGWAKLKPASCFLCSFRSSYWRVRSHGIIPQWHLTCGGHLAYQVHGVILPWGDLLCRFPLYIPWEWIITKRPCLCSISLPRGFSLSIPFDMMTFETVPIGNTMAWLILTITCFFSHFCLPIILHFL